MKSVIAVAFAFVAGAAASGFGGDMLFAGGHGGCLDGGCGGYGGHGIDQHYGYAPYHFGYNFHDDHYGSHQSREEVADGHGGVKGSYSFVDGHGIKRTVEYVADKGGFRANVKTNEPGTKTSNPADAFIMSSAPDMPHAGDLGLGKGYGFGGNFGGNYGGFGGNLGGYGGHLGGYGGNLGGYGGNFGGKGVAVVAGPMLALEGNKLGGY